MKQTFLLIVAALLLSIGAYAQRPKMHLKAKAGFHTTAFVYKEAEITRDYFFGLQGGFGFRVMHKKKMGEVDFDFVRSYLTGTDSLLGDYTIRLNSFELPLTAGYVTLKKPLIKHFLYGGFVVHFNVKSFIYYTDETGEEASIKIKPKELDFTNPNFAMRLGTQVDIAMFNIDFNYNLGLNKPVDSNIRTQSHHVQLNLGLVF